MKRRTYQRAALPSSQGAGYPMSDTGKPYRCPVKISCEGCGQYIKPEQSRGMVNVTWVRAGGAETLRKLVHLNGRCDQ